MQNTIYLQILTILIHILLVSGSKKQKITNQTDQIREEMDFEYKMIKKPIELRKFENEIVDIKLNRFSGINIMMKSSLFDTNQNNQVKKLIVKTCFGRFEFFYKKKDKIEKIDQGSTREVIKNFYELDDNLKMDENKSQLFDQFMNLFYIDINMKIYLSAKVYIRKISKIFFKKANLESLTVLGQTNTTLRRYFIEFQEDFFNYSVQSKNQSKNQSNNIRQFNLNSSIKSFDVFDCYNIIQFIRILMKWRK